MFVSRDGRALIGYLSKWGGLSRSGVRFLEERGVLQGGEDSDGMSAGYHTFDSNDFLRLEMFQRYRSMGFSQNDALDMCACTPTEALKGLEERMKDEQERYKAVMERLGKAQQLIRLAESADAGKWSLTTSPSFLCLPDPLEAARALTDSGALDADLDELAREDIALHKSLPMDIGLIFHEVDGEMRNERVMLIELTSNTGVSLAPENIEYALVMPPFSCLRFVTRATASQAVSLVPDRVHEMAQAAGVHISLDGAIGRALHIRRTDDDLLVTLEVWAPVIERTGE